MKNILLSFIGISLFFFGFGQTEGSVFTSTGRGVSTTFVTDYQSLGINPANLAWSKEFRGKRFAIGFLETGFSLSSPILNSPIVNESRAIPFNFNFKKDGNYNDFQEFSKDLETGFKLNVDVRLFGIALTTGKVGLAFAVTERYSMNVGLSKDFAEIATFGFGAQYFDTLSYEQGGSVYKINNTPSNYDSLQKDTSIQLIAGTSNNPKTIPELMEGTRIQVSWIREFNFGFGTQIIKNEKWGLYAGVGVKYLQGMALIDMSAANNNFNGFMSYSPSFDGNGQGLFSSGNYRAKLPKAAGSGYGIDLGVNVKAFKKLKIGLSVNDIGSITWKENTYAVSADTFLRQFEVGGFYKNSDSIQSNSGGATFDSILNNLVDIESGNFERKVVLPSTLRFGASIQIGKWLELGGEFITPLNDRPGNLTTTVYSLGGDIKLGPFVLSSGAVMQNNEILRIPAGVVISPFNGAYELGLSTRDLKSLIKLKDSENPMFSTAFGFLRFRF